MIVSRPGVRGYLTLFPNIARRPLEKHVLLLQMVLCRGQTQMAKLQLLEPDA